MSGVPLPSTTLSPADTRKVQHVAVHAARATCMLKAEALLTSPQAGRPPGQSGHQRLFWLQLCTQGLLFALQPGKSVRAHPTGLGSRCCRTGGRSRGGSLPAALDAGKNQGGPHHPTLPQPAPSRTRTLEAGKRWARLAQARAASRPGLCATAPGRRAEAPPLWQRPWDSRSH